MTKLQEVIKSTPMAFGDHRNGAMVFVEYVRFDYPRKGEYYISGAIAEVWQAVNDIQNSRFHIVRPTHHAKQVHTWARGEEFK